MSRRQRPRCPAGYADPVEEDEHRRLLEDAAGKLAGHGIDAATTEQAGDTGDAIVALARELGIDLVVVRSRHRPLVERLLFGSVSAEVVLKAPCDVLLIR